MAGQTPNRGLPFPHDTDQIDVAGDIEKLAMGVDASEQQILDWATPAFIQARAELDLHRATLDQYFDWFVANNATNDAQNAAIAALGGGNVSGGRKVYGDRGLYTTTTSGYVEVRWPVNTFAPNSIETAVVLAQIGNTGGDRIWQMGAVWGTSWEGFGCHFSLNGGNMADAQVWVHYIATGIAP